MVAHAFQPFASEFVLRDRVQLLGIKSLAHDVRALGMNWVHLPIVDVSIPDSRFEDAWVNDGPKLHDRLDAGEKILIHCRGGLGRTGIFLLAGYWSNAGAHRSRPFNEFAKSDLMQSKHPSRKITSLKSKCREEKMTI